MPVTYLTAAYTAVTVSDSDIRYIRWRSYQGSTYGDWVAEVH